MEVKKVGVISVAKIYAILMGIVGVFMGVLLAFASLFAAFFDPTAGALGFILTLFFLLVYPLLYAAMGFVTGVISAWLYNIIAAKVGGIEVELGR